jgi:hypothetical protein
MYRDRRLVQEAVFSLISGQIREQDSFVRGLRCTLRPAPAGGVNVENIKETP